MTRYGVLAGSGNIGRFKSPQPARSKTELLNFLKEVPTSLVALKLHSLADYNTALALIAEGVIEVDAITGILIVNEVS